MEYRILPTDEWVKLEPFFNARGIPLPLPTFAQIVVAETDGEIVGFLTKQLLAHLEPLSIAPSFRGKCSWKRMAHLLDMTNTWVFADSPERERMCELAGMQKQPFTVYFKDKN